MNTIEFDVNNDILTNKQICRICLENHVLLYSLFRKRSDGIAPYDKIINYVKLNLDLVDTGPTCICSQCVIELDTTVKFLEKCEQSNKYFSSIPTTTYIEVTEEHHLVQHTVNHTVNHTDDVTKINGYTIEEEDEELTEEMLLEKAMRDVEDITEEEKINKLLPPELLHCPECGSRKRCEHWTPPTQYICEHCNKCFNRKFNFLLHLKRHTGQREFQCSTCGIYCITRSVAARHCRPRIRHPCPITGCMKSFTTTTNLRTHMRMHNGERPLQCPVCDKHFACRNTLNNHKRIHTGERPYMCVVCGKSFTTNKLSSHMRTHTGVRPYACRHFGCMRAFPSARALASHQLTHAVVKEYHTCVLCGARYNHKQSLNKHLRKHHGQIPQNVLNNMAGNQNRPENDQG